MKTFQRFSLALLAATLFSFPVSGQQRRPITLQDLVSLNPFAGQAGVLAPDGKHFAVVEKGQIALLPVDGSAPVPVTATQGAKSEVSWSADSKKLAFVSQGQIWVVPVSGGEPVKLTNDPAGPGDPRGATDHLPKWNPNGKWILYESGRRGWNQLYVVSEDGKAEHLIASTEIYTGGDVIASSAPDQGDAVSSDRFAPNPSWSPDGTRLSYTERSRELFSGKLNIVAFDQNSGTPTGSPRTLYTARNDVGGAWAVNTAAWSPDSKTLAVVLQETGWDKVFLIPAAGGKAKQLTTGEWEDETPVYAPNGKWIAVVSNRNLPEERHIWIVLVDGSAPWQLTHHDGVENDPQWSPDSSTIYFGRGTSLRNPATYFASIRGENEPRPLRPLQHSIFEQARLPTPEVAHFKGKDGLPLAGILFRPLGFRAGVRYPTVIWAHGGPEGQVTLSLSPWSLFLAQEGFVVFEPNFRGSTGYGERFRNLNVKDSGGGEVDDIAAAVHYLIIQGFADPSRVGIGGAAMEVLLLRMP
jgi:dipeptidyl aminopeptidase/acylaminoacyl peptidase